MPELNKKTLRNILLVLCGCILFYWLLNQREQVSVYINMISSLTAPFVFGGVLAFILNVPMRAFENGLLKKMKMTTLRRAIAVILTFIMLLLVVALVFWLLIPQIVETLNSLIPSLSRFFLSVQHSITDFLNENPKLLEWLTENTNFENMNWSNVIKDALAKLGDAAYSIVGSAISAIGGIFTGVFNAVIAIIFSVYCLFQKETLARQGRKLLYAFTKEKTADNIIRILRLTNTTFSNFLSGQCIEVCILGSMFAICMAIFRMPYIPLISVVIAVTAFIPIVGAWIGCVLGTFLIFVEDPMLAVWFVIMFLVIQQIENGLIYPRVVGTSVGLPGMWVLLAVSLGGELMGVIGMFLMIPFSSVLYTLLREMTHKRLLGKPIDEAKLEPQPPELTSKLRGSGAQIKNPFKRKKKVQAEQPAETNE